MTYVQPDLFGSPPSPLEAPAGVISGLELAGDFLSEAEELDLIARIDGTDLSPFKFQQWEGKRQTASFGWRYDFTTGKIGVAAAFPDWLLPIRDRAAHFADLAPEALVQALLIRYDAGAGIGWHKDRPVFEHVVGISLGNCALMRFRRRTPRGFDRAKTELAPRSIYRLSGEVRHLWEHSIAPMEVPRWSITFRSLAGGGRKQLDASGSSRVPSH